MARAYPQDGRSSVARPSNHEKSQPSTEAASASATRASKRASEAEGTKGAEDPVMGQG